MSVSFSHVKESYISKTKTKADPGGADPGGADPGGSACACSGVERLRLDGHQFCPSGAHRDSPRLIVSLSLWPPDSAFGSPYSNAVPTKVTLLTFLNSVLCTLAAWLEFLAALAIL